jgi:hypothetical protein
MNNMNAKKIKEELDKYKRQYRNLVSRCEQLESQLIAADEREVIMRNNLLHAQNALDSNKAMLRQMVAEQSKKEHGLIDLMNGLKAKLREMGYDGNFDRLGNQGN